MDEGNTKIQVALLTQQSENFKVVFDRFESIIDKMSTAAASFQGVIAVHDQKITQIQEGQKAVNQKINIVKKTTDKRIEDVETDLASKLDVAVAAVVTNQTANHEEVKTLLSAHDKRLGKLERWMWIVVGGGLVVAFLMQKADFGFLSRIF